MGKKKFSQFFEEKQKNIQSTILSPVFPEGFKNFQWLAPPPLRGLADHGLEAPPAPEGLELSARSSSSRGAAEPAGPLLQGFISRADIDMEAPGTYHPLDDEWCVAGRPLSGAVRSAAVHPLRALCGLCGALPPCGSGWRPWAPPPPRSVISMCV